jgi:hypothetical protein
MRERLRRFCSKILQNTPPQPASPPACPLLTATLWWEPRYEYDKLSFVSISLFVTLHVIQEGLMQNPRSRGGIDMSICASLFTET